MKIFEVKSFLSAEERKKIRSLHGKKRLQYIWDYYKIPILIALILLYICGYSIYGRVTHKEPVLYTGLVNVMPGETLAEKLGEGFLREYGKDESKYEHLLRTGLYLTENTSETDQQYVYASQMKILAGIEGKQLDVVIFDKEAFDAFSQNGYLCNIYELLEENNASLLEKLKPYIVTNIHIIKDNAKEVAVDQRIPYKAETKSYPMGIDLSKAPMFLEAGFDDKVYLGVVANSPRMDAAVEYIEYLYQEA